MANIVKYKEFMRQGAGKFARELGNEYLVVSNEKRPDDTFVVIRLLALKDEYERLGQTEKALDLRNAYEAIIATVKDKYKFVRSFRRTWKKKEKKED